MGNLAVNSAQSPRREGEKDITFGHDALLRADDRDDAQEVSAPTLQRWTSRERPARPLSIPVQHRNDIHEHRRLDVERLTTHLSPTSSAIFPPKQPAPSNMPLFHGRSRRTSSSNTHGSEVHNAAEQGKSSSRKSSAIGPANPGFSITPAPMAAASPQPANLSPYSLVQSSPEQAFLSPSLPPLSSSMSSSSSVNSDYPASPDLTPRDHRSSSKIDYLRSRKSFNDSITGSSDSCSRPPLPSRWSPPDHLASQVRQNSLSNDDEDEDSSSSEHIRTKRAQAFTALTGQQLSINSRNLLFAAMSMPDLHSHATLPAWSPFMLPTTDSPLEYEIPPRFTNSPMTVSADSVRRRVTSLGASDTPRSSVHFAESPPRRPRVLSAGADDSPRPGSSHLRYGDRRRSLSKDNSLLATRIASAFLVKELGEHVLQRRPASTPPDQWPSDQHEQRDLWLALLDGISLCRLLSRIVPGLHLQLMHQDTASARHANVTLFLAQAKLHLPLQVHDYFDVQDLLRGNPATFDRVVHMICAIAEIVANREAKHRAASPHGSNVRNRSKQADLIGQNVTSSSTSGDSDRRSKKTSLPGPSRIPLPKSRIANLSTNYAPSRSVPASTSTAVSSVNLASSTSSSDGKSWLSRPTIVRSSTGNQIRLRTKSRVSGTPSPPLSDDGHVMLSRSRTSNELTRQPSPLAPALPRRPSIYGKHSDKRASESAVDVMAVLQEGGEAPRQRRSVSDRPAHITARLAADAAARAAAAHPLPASVIMQGRSDTKQVHETVASATEEKPKPRPMSPTSNASRPASLQSIPFPGSVSDGHVAAGSQDRWSQEVTASPMIQSAVDLPTLTYQRASDSLVESPRKQHKRWNSDVHENSPHQARVLQAIDLSRARHDSCDPPAHRVQRRPRQGHRLPSDAGKRRSTSRPNSTDVSRDRVVVRDVHNNTSVYLLGECIGRGQFGSVYRGLNIESGSVVAVKRIRLEGKSPDQIHQLQKEVDLLKWLSHPTVVRYEGSALSKGYINIVLEYVENGSLLRTLDSFGPLGEDLIAAIVVQIIDGLVYLHGVNVIHRDLKSANILSTKSGNIKLTDFGVSLQTDAVKETMKFQAETATGTPYWMAPEVIMMSGASFPSDVWSLGCVIIELLTGRPPYSDLMPLTAMYRIAEEEMPIPACSEQLHDFLLQCFAKDASSRPTALECLKHPWLKVYRVNMKMLRTQDSIPFMKRMGTQSPVSDGEHGVQRPSEDGTTGAHYAMDLTNMLDRVLSPVYMSPPSGMSRTDTRSPDTVATSHRGSSAHPHSPLSMHNFVESHFSRAIGCKVCHQIIAISKTALVCESCGIICHIDCAVNPLNICDTAKHILPMSPPIDSAGSRSHQLEASSPLSSPMSFVVKTHFADSGRQPPIELEPVPARGKVKSHKRPMTSAGVPSPDPEPAKASRGFDLRRTISHGRDDLKTSGRKNKVSHGDCIIA